jgi:ribonuclease BN (tRNA processing enzyme)
MKLRALGCFGGNLKGRHLTCFLLNDTVALDAGSITETLTFEEQTRVRHVVISHSHLDHNGSLPFLVDNVFGLHDGPVVVYSIPAVVDALRRFMFNDELWPDFTRLPSQQFPTLRFQEVQEERPFVIEELTFIPVRVNHITPTVGFVIDDGKSAIIYTGDTGPTARVWEVANRTPNLRAIITEASFPNEKEELANQSGHMTPEMLGRELAKLNRRVKILVSHVKPRWRSRISRELSAIHSPRIELIQQGKTYRF